MSGSSAQASEPVPDCPKCARPMVRRTARKGANAGSECWGCSGFPRCTPPAVNLGDERNHDWRDLRIDHPLRLRRATLDLWY